MSRVRRARSAGWFLLRQTGFIAGSLLAIVFTVLLITEMARSGGASTGWDAAGRSVTATWQYLLAFLQGDLGMTLAFGRETSHPVSEVLARTVPKSLGLLFASLAAASATGLSMGILAALRRHSRLASVLLSLSTLGISAPSFFVAMLLLIFAVSFYRETGVRLVPAYGFGWDRHLILPVLVLAARPAASIARLSFIALSDVLDQDHVRTARSKGLRPRTVLIRHTLRNAAVPLLTAIGASLRSSLAILPVVEFFFSWPGVGLELLDAIRRPDANLVTALILSLAVTFLLTNLLLDLLHRTFDPKLREATAGG